MKQLTALAFISPILLAGCAPRQPPSNPLEVQLTCPGYGYLDLKRDMSAVVIVGKAIPLYSVRAKDLTWIYSESEMSSGKKVGLKFDNITHSYIANVDGRGFVCKAPTASYMPPIPSNDYTSPSAIKDNQIRNEVKKEREDNAIKNKKTLAITQRKCSIYAKDIVEKTGLMDVRVLNANSAGYLTSCVITGRDAVYGSPVILRIMGNGSRYEYQKLN